jgi:hypothetical protein
MLSLRTVGSIGESAFPANKLSTVTFPAGYCHRTISIVIELPLLFNLIILVSVADLIRLTNIGDYAFALNQLTSVTFLG